MEEKKKLLIIDTLFFRKLKDVDRLTNQFLANLKTDFYITFFQSYDKVLINNGLDEYDKDYKDNDFTIKNSISEIDFELYSFVMYCNLPFFNLNVGMFDKIVINIPENTLLGQIGYNLSFENEKKTIFSKAKANQNCNLISPLFYMFAPKNIKTFEDQSHLLKHFHLTNYPFVYTEFVNLLSYSDFQLFEGGQELVDFCLYDYYNKSSYGKYAIKFTKETEKFTKEEFVKYLETIIENNDKLNIEIKSDIDFSEYFDQSIEEIDGELCIKSGKFNSDASRVNCDKNTFYYENSNFNGVIDLDDLHLRHFLTGSSPKFFKILNTNYLLMNNIKEEDLKESNSIALKRTIGMGDAALALTIGYKIWKKYGKKINWYSKYDFRPYLIEDFIENYYQVDESCIFDECFNNEDLVIDLDLAYENQLDGNSFYDCYSNLFDPDALDFNSRNDVIFKYHNLAYAVDVVLCAEGSGWKGKEGDIDVFEKIARYLSEEKKMKISEPGYNRFTHYSTVRNPEKSLDVVFQHLSTCKFYVGCDNGMLHLANLLGKPSFLINGATDSLKTVYNLDLIYTYGKRDLLCFGCRNNFKGSRNIGERLTFVTYCYNQKQYECVQGLEENVIDELERFLLQFDLDVDEK